MERHRAGTPRRTRQTRERRSPLGRQHRRPPTRHRRTWLTWLPHPADRVSHPRSRHSVSGSRPLRSSSPSTAITARRLCRSPTRWRRAHRLPAHQMIGTEATTLRNALTLIPSLLSLKYFRILLAESDGFAFPPVATIETMTSTTNSTPPSAPQRSHLLSSMTPPPRVAPPPDGTIRSEQHTVNSRNRAALARPPYQTPVPVRERSGEADRDDCRQSASLSSQTTASPERSGMSPDDSHRCAQHVNTLAPRQPYRCTGRRSTPSVQQCHPVVGGRTCANARIWRSVGTRSGGARSGSREHSRCLGD